MFDRIAGTYDLLNDCISLGLHRRWKERACKLLQLESGDRVLDLCTGTGDLITHLLPLVGDTGQVMGLDFSEAMLTVAQKRFSGNPQVMLQQGDAMSLPYEDNLFDGAIVAFGLRNVEDISLALAEMRRVVKPGAWVVSLDTSPNPKIPGFWVYFKVAVPLLAQLLAQAGGAYRYLGDSTQAFLDPQTLKTRFEKARLKQVHAIPLTGHAAVMVAGQKPF